MVAKLVGCDVIAIVLSSFRGDAKIRRGPRTHQTPANSDGIWPTDGTRILEYSSAGQPFAVDGQDEKIKIGVCIAREPGKSMTPEIVTVETSAWVCQFQREMRIRLTYIVRWNPDAQTTEDFLLHQEVLGEANGGN